MVKKFKIQGNLPKTTQVNKALIIGALAVLSFVIVFGIVTAFNSASTPQKKSQELSVTTNDTSQTEAIPENEILKNLPENYQDLAKIRQFQKGSTSDIPSDVQHELEFLKREQVELEQRLSALRVQGNQSGNRTNPMVQQAQSSNLFFPGTMPTSEEILTKKTSEEQKDQKKTSQEGTKSEKNPYEAQNMQDQKIKFLEPSDEAEDIYDLHNIVEPISPFEVQAGTLIPAVLITSINSSLPGDAVAQVRQDIYDSVTGKFLLVPKGSKLLGEYDSRIAYGQRRVLIAFTRIIRPDGSSIVLSKTSGTDLKGQAGMEGLVDNHWMTVLSAATLSTILSVGAGAVSDRSIEPNTLYQSAKQGAILGGASNISQVGQNISDRAMNIQPTLVIPSGFQFNVIVKKDMVLKPYKLLSNKKFILP